MTMRRLWVADEKNFITRSRDQAGDSGLLERSRETATNHQWQEARQLRESVLRGGAVTIEHCGYQITCC